MNWGAKNQKPLRGEPYLTIKIIKAERETFWYYKEVGNVYYVFDHRQQHRNGNWFYWIVDYDGSGRLVNENDIMILDNYKLPERLFEV